MNNRLIATLAALAIAAPLMGCADDETNTPEQQEGVKQEPTKDDSTATDQTATAKDDTATKDEKVRQAEPNSCEPAVGDVSGTICYCGYCWPY